MGVIDNTYCGNDDIWKFPALSTKPTKVRKGDRICQFRIVKQQPEIAIETVDNLEGKNRGGLGSTGVS